jgi:hypothetical protein
MGVKIVIAVVLVACSPRPTGDTAPTTKEPRPAPDAASPREPVQPREVSGPPAPRPASAPVEIAQSPDACACENSVGVPIEDTHCGYLICGTDRQVYRCGRHVGGTPWTLVEPVRQCAAPGKITAEKAIQLGDDCSKGQSCSAPSTCVSYRGIAGARGPTFKTCEIKCTKGSACPSGTRCVQIADGPGEVCR